MIVEIKIPEIGESITEGVLVEWYAEDGAVVRAEDQLYELETEKITQTILAQQGGRLKILVPAGSEVTVGQVVGTIDTSVEAEPSAPSSAEAPTAKAAAPTPSGPDAGSAGKAEAPPLHPPAGLPTLRARAAQPETLEGLSPAVRRLVVEHGLSATAIKGTGKDGRLTKGDVLRYLEKGGAAQEAPASGEAQAAPAPPAAAGPAEGGGSPAAPSQPAAASAVAPEPAPVPAVEVEPTAEADAGQPPRQTRKKMSLLRQKIAERMVQAQQTAAILTTFNEADMTRVIELRTRFRERFKERYGVSLGFMSFFVKAVVDALKAVPQLNAQIQGDEIVTNHFYDIGIAVSTPFGLVVPVIRDADKLSFAQIEQAIRDFAGRARERKLTLKELTGGCFTISNGGVFGSLLSTPILNPPQSGILGLHAIKRRPVAVGDEIQIRPMMYLALSYDHRLVDGEQAVTFLRRIVEVIEDPERLMLEV